MRCLTRTNVRRLLEPRQQRPDNRQATDILSVMPRVQLLEAFGERANLSITQPPGQDVHGRERAARKSPSLRRFLALGGSRVR